MRSRAGRCSTPRSGPTACSATTSVVACSSRRHGGKGRRLSRGRAVVLRPALAFGSRRGLAGGRIHPRSALRPLQPRGAAPPSRRAEGAGHRARSEEHTSELQSRRDLVCRLLLEKKKKKKKKTKITKKKKTKK